MATKKTGPDYRRAMRSVLKTELQSLLKKLADNGEESLVITTTVGDPHIPTPVFSRLGEEFYKKERHCVEEMGKKFHSYCQGHSVANAPSHSLLKASSTDRKRKLSASEDEGDYYAEMSEVVVYVTEGDSAKVAVGRKDSIISTVDESSSDVPVFNEALQQITIPAQRNGDTTTKFVILEGSGDNQAASLWTDYVSNKSSAADRQKQETDIVQSEGVPDSQVIVDEAVDVTGSPQVAPTNSKAASNASFSKEQVQNEKTHKVMAGQGSSSGMSPSPQRRRYCQEISKAEAGPDVENTERPSTSGAKIPEPSPLTRYMTNMATGKSIMIRAGEDCFEQIETISIADTISDKKSEAVVSVVEQTDSQLSVSSEASLATSTIAPLSDAEIIITEDGNKVHILKNGTTEEDQETFDIAFEDMFDLLGKSARCLVCGKIMLKRNRRYHWRFHTGAKPYICEYCHKGFYHPSNLKSHLFIHVHRNK